MRHVEDCREVSLTVTSVSNRTTACAFFASVPYMLYYIGLHVIGIRFSLPRGPRDVDARATSCLSPSPPTHPAVSPLSSTSQKNYGPTLVDTNIGLYLLPSSFRYYKKNTDDYAQLGWQFTGLQRTGLYRNWPLIYQ